MTHVNILIYNHKKPQPSRSEWRTIVKNMIESVTRSPAKLLFDSLGKPHLDNPKISISYSHTKNTLALALVQDDVRIGLDIERASRMSEIQQIQKFAFSREEQYTTAADLVSNWCLKEAAVKMSGQGFYDYDPVEVAIFTENSSFSAKAQNHEITRGYFKVIKGGSLTMAICSDQKFSVCINYWQGPITEGAKDDA